MLPETLVQGTLELIKNEQLVQFEGIVCALKAMNASGH